MKIIGKTVAFRHGLFFATLCVLLLSSLTESMAGEIEALFIKGNELYQNGEYQAAIAQYKKINELGYQSWEVYYNLGNAYYKSGQIARAILYYERARRLNPKNEDIDFNLELANLSVVDRIAEFPKIFPAAWISTIANFVGLQGLGVITIVVYSMLIGLIIYRFLRRGNRSSRVNMVSIVVCGFLLTVCSGLLSMKIYDNENRLEAIVLAPKVDVRSAPDDDSTEMFTLHEGVKVQLKDRSGEWVKIRLSDRKVGWLKIDVIEKI